MDLLDLELDLDVEEGSSSPARVTRRSQSNVTPKVAPKPAKPTASTPKTSSTVVKSTPKSTVKAAPKTPATTAKTPAKTPAKSPVATAPKAPSKTPVKKTVEPPVVEESMESANEGASTSESAPRGRSRSPSLEKRSRNKAKKRFSPSPVSKKRKSIVTSTPGASAPKKKVVRGETEAAFAENLREFGEMLSQRDPVDFDIPNEWKSPKPSKTVEKIISQITAKSSSDTKDQPATSAQTPSSSRTNSNKKSVGQKQARAPIGQSRMETDSNSDSISTEEAADRRSFSEELGVDDSEPVQKTAPSKNSARRTSRRDTDQGENSEAPKKEIRRKSSVKPKVVEDIPSTSSEVVEPEPVNPNSVVTVKPRLAGGATKTRVTERKVKTKGFEDPAEAVPEQPAEVVEEPAPSTPSVPEPSKAPAKKPVVVTAPPARSSGRVSKPNRLYNDESFNTEILGRNRVTEQNPVKEAQAKEATPEPVEIPLPILSRRKSVAVPRTPPAPKPIPVVNGVQSGYVPSVKVPLEDYEVDGVVVKLNAEVNGTLDKILLKVCNDGVKMHEDIDPKVVKGKQRAKMDHAKRMRLQNKKLDIQMKIKIPSSSTEEMGKRKRHAPKSIDDYWTPPNRLKLKTDTKEEEREETPIDDQDPLPVDERRQQKARESISNLFDAEMDATMKEAKKYSVSFDKYMRPKLAGARKHANVKLMSRKRQSADPDDFYYQELIVDQVSPSNSNVENVDGTEEIDVVDMDVDQEEEVSHEGAKTLRTEALDTAEQVAVVIPRPTRHDGQPLTMEQIQAKALEHLETRKMCLSETLDIVLNQFSHEMAPPTRGVEEQGCIWHTLTSANAQHLKNIYTLSDSFKEDAISWTHQFMVENLPVHILASYLSVLRYARRLNASRFAYVISTTDQLDAEWTEVTSLIRTFVHKKVSEPGTEVLNNTIPYRRMENTVFLLVSPTLTSGDHQQRHRQHGRIFRWLQSIGHADSETIGFGEEIDESTSVAEYLSDVIVDKICEKVRQKHREKPQRNIVLVGYGAATYLVHRAANLVSGISAIISIAFPVMSPFGRRGTADDEILLTYCPTLFIVGSDGQRFNNNAMTELRASMISNTGLVVVGHANDLLMVPSALLVRLGISQTVVYRIIIEKILDFLNLDAVRQQPLSDLVPIELNNIYDLDSSILKSDKALSGLAFANSPSASSSAAPSPVGSSGRRTTDERRKKDPSAPSPSPRSGDLAFQSYMTSNVATGDDLPRRSSIGSKPRVVERGDFRDHRPTTSSMLPRPSGGPLDPASISLN